MCNPLIIGAASLVVSALGTAASYSAGQDASAAARSAQDQAVQNQNASFYARNAAEGQRTLDQTAVNNASSDQFTRNQTQQREDQSRALDARDQAIRTTNQQTAAASTQADEAVREGAARASPSNLADAQTDQVAAQTALNAPSVSAIQVSNPTASSGSGTVTGDAIAKGRGAAAKYVQSYGDKQAALAGFNAPVSLANRTATEIGTNLMPAASADALFKTGVPAILAPSSTAYTNAGAYGAAARGAGALQTTNATALVNTKAGNAIDLTNLTQTDQANLIQGTLNVNQARAAAAAGLGSAVGSLGNLGIQYAGSRGAFAGILPKTPLASPLASPLAE